MYTLTDDNELQVKYTASCDKKTIINLTNHSCFNLAGHSRGGVLSHQIKIDADEITVIDGNYIPTGQIKNVKNNEFDLNYPLNTKFLRERSKFAVDASFERKLFLSLHLDALGDEWNDEVDGMHIFIQNNDKSRAAYVLARAFMDADILRVKKNLD